MDVDAEHHADELGVRAREGRGVVARVRWLAIKRPCISSVRVAKSSEYRRVVAAVFVAIVDCSSSSMCSSELLGWVWFLGIANNWYQELERCPVLWRSPTLFVLNTGTVELQLLTKTNYHLWSMVMQVSLEAMELWDVVEAASKDRVKDQRALATIV
jgi:hypothetical protein